MGRIEGVPVAAIARICHEANRAYCHTLGDNSQVSWDEAPANIQQSAVNGVSFIINNPAAPPSAAHESWLAFKTADGWVHGTVKDSEKKTHPCMMPYEELPVEQRRKDILFGAIVRAMLVL